MPLNYDKLTATTLSKYKKRLTDNIFTARALTYWLMNKGRMRFEDGGNKIVEPLIYAQNSATVAKSYADWDTFSTATAQTENPISAAEFSWKQAGGLLAMSGIEEAKNSGEAAILNLLDAKVQVLEETMRENFNTMFFSDGTGNSAKDWDGLKNLVETTGTVGTIDRATYTWWRAYKEATAAALTIPYMATAYNTTSKGNDVPDFIITTQTLFEKYESLVQPQLRFQDTKMADAGFQNFMYKGAPVMFDTACTAGYMYFLNSKYIQLVGHSDNWFKTRNRTIPDDSDGWYQFIKCYGNLTIRNCARQGVLQGKTA